MASDLPNTTHLLSNKRVAADLPDDAWLLISDTLQTARLSHVNRRLYGLLRHRHATLKCTRDTLCAKLRAVQHFRKVHTLSLAVPWCPERTLEADAEEALVTTLQVLPALEVLRLSLANKALRAPAFGVLTSLPAPPRLRTVSLHLLHCSLADQHVAALAHLSTAPGLSHLTLRLSFNAITGAGVRALTALRRTPQLHTLRLALSCTEVGDEGLAALATLGHAPALRSLSLALEKAGVTDRGAKAAASILSRSPRLHFLSLDLGQNLITDAGAVSFLSLRQAPALTALQLGLALTAVGGSGGQALRALTAGSAIQHLHLELPNNPDCAGLSVKGPRCWYRGGQLAPWW